MATPAYVPLDPNAPDGITQTPAAYSASDLANVRALRDAIVTGVANGWTYFQSASSMRPANRVWAHTTLNLQLKMTTTYAGPSNMPNTVQWFWSNDAGATFVQIGALTTLTWDAGLLIVTTADFNTGSWVSWLQSYMQGIIAREAIATHAGLAGGAAHGLGTMSTQNANAVAITGGNVSNVNVQNSNLINFGRVYPVAPGVLGAGAWNWAGGGGSQSKIAPGTVITIANPVAGEVKRLWVTGAGAITINSGGGVTFSWAKGMPVWGAFATLVSCVAVENNFVVGSTTPID